MQIDLITGAPVPMTLIYIQDPGHGWIETSMEHVKRLGLAGEISQYSYISRDGKTVYLEEDCDASRYMTACKTAGIEVALKEHHCFGNAFIRRLPSYPAQRRLIA